MKGKPHSPSLSPLWPGQGLPCPPSPFLLFGQVSQVWNSMVWLAG